jgi:catechol 2,3-dioxygenase-like lactoylglutathione lyase family enzyme
MGLPLILYDPLASFIGWLALMIVVSPALQFVVTIFGAWVAVTVRLGDGFGSSRKWRALRERPAASPGIVFFKSRQYDAVRRFYRDELGLGVWLEQADCTIFRHGTLLVGFCDREEADTGGIITLCLADRAAVDRLHERFRDRALGPPAVNEKYRIYQCFIRDPEGRLVEFQQFLDPVPDADAG